MSEQLLDAAADRAAPADAPAAHEAPLRSVHTTSFPQLLDLLGISLLVTTYQAGKLVALRAQRGVLNTHFRVFQRPMGLAVDRNRLAIGTAREIAEFHNMPAVARKLEPAGTHDACFMPRVCHFTGDVRIHEMAWSDDQLWFINTAFSCLCTRHDRYSFEPRWRPTFVSELTPEDRCHLNGLAIVAGRPRYVTALGATNTAGGWRENKRDGGILIDLTTDEIIARGLSMPHSPRWYQGRLWLLNSGTGGFGTIDQRTGRYDEIARLPGFTRGLAFQDRWAFIGLSQVRESATFSGIPLVEQMESRSCGVWVVDLQTGNTVAYVKFADAVQEIFAVEVLPGIRYPDLINDNQDLLDSSFMVPDSALHDVPASIRARNSSP